MCEMIDLNTLENKIKGNMIKIGKSINLILKGNKTSA